MSECTGDVMSNHILKELTDSQRKAVLHIEGPLLVLAGPGSGKTRVITHRIASLIESGVAPYNIAAITFTNKAAEEMRERAASLGASGGAHMSTFHSLCVRILRQYSDAANVEPNFSIYDSREQTQCVKQAISDCSIDTGNFPPARMLNAISTLKNNLEEAEDFANGAYDFFSQVLGRIYVRYQEILRASNALDFDDLLMKTACLLKGNSEVRGQLGRRFQFLMVDEYQDTNHAQYEIARAIGSEHNNICVTGDPDQSIYRWRGADIRNILAFEEDWPEAMVIKLEENFRSTPAILAAADKLISANKARKPKKLISTRPAGGEVVVQGYVDEKQEAAGLTEEIKAKVKDGVSFSDMAIFYRVNSMSRILEETFIKNKIPYQIVRGVEFYSRKEIRDMLGYLKVLVNPSDEVALLRIINMPARGIGKVTIQKVADYARENNVTLYEGLKKSGQIDSLAKGTKTKIAVFVNMIEDFKKDIDGPVGKLAEKIFTVSGLKRSLQVAKDELKDELANVNELISAAAQYDKDTEDGSALDYLQQISLFSDADAYDKASERVAFMTLHTAKGLEFDNVFIVGLVDGTLPHERSGDDEAEIEEERRLFFVGITRAKTNLHISYPQYKVVRGQQLRMVPSQFLYELGVEISQVEQQWPEQDDDVTQEVYSDEPTEQFTTNQLVRHKIFGLGRVEDFVDMGENSIIVIKFNSGQIKSLKLKYADISRVEGF